jgi:membrane-associated phospholipid phosphatase
LKPEINQQRGLSNKRGQIRIYIFILAALIAFLILAYFARIYPYFKLDIQITLWLQSYKMSWLQQIMTGVSWLGFFPQAALVVIAVSLLLYFRGLVWEAILALLIPVGAESLDFIAKLVIHRPRESANLVHVAQLLPSYSFPSGHVMFFSGFFGYLCCLSYLSLKPGFLRFSLMAGFAGLIGLVGVSRVYLGAHWPSDVVGGYLASSALLVAMIQFYRMGQSRHFFKQE